MRRPYSVLHPVGFTVPRVLPRARCALAAPFRPYRPEGRRYAFCGTFPDPEGPPGVTRHRRSVEPGLSSPHRSEPRSPGPLASGDIGVLEAFGESLVYVRSWKNAGRVYSESAAASGQSLSKIYPDDPEGLPLCRHIATQKRTVSLALLQTGQAIRVYCDDGSFSPADAPPEKLVRQRASVWSHRSSKSIVPWRTSLKRA